MMVRKVIVPSELVRNSEVNVLTMAGLEAMEAENKNQAEAKKNKLAHAIRVAGVKKRKEEARVRKVTQARERKEALAKKLE